jgi:hypothetical protein
MAKRGLDSDPAPKNLLMVLAFVGDSTITNLFIVISLRHFGHFVNLWLKVILSGTPCLLAGRKWSRRIFFKNIILITYNTTGLFG